MGLIKALTTSTSSALGDQFKEFVTCPTTDNNVVIQRGIVQHGNGNRNPSEGVLSNGTTIAVPEGMSMMIIDNGAITEFSAEAGTYTYDNSSEPSVFVGGLGKGIIDTIKTIGKRITYGGMPAKDQRVYYINTKVVIGNKFGSPQPKKITDEKYGMLEVTFFGEYAFKVEDPALLINNIVGTNPKDTLTFEEVVGDQLKAKFVEQLTQAIGIVMRKHKVSFGDMTMYGADLANEMNTVLNDSWKEKYGLIITDVALADVNLTEESMARVSKIDDAKIFSDASMQSGLMASATADAMKTAAGNENGAMMGFMGMTMANNNGATAMGVANKNVTEAVKKEEPAMPEPGTLFNDNEPVKKEEPVVETPTTGSKRFCTNCGKEVTGNFCGECGTKVE